MTPRPFETPAEIALRYGCDPARAPREIQRIPRGVSAFAPGEAPSWKAACAKGHRLGLRTRQFEALARREREAAAPPAPEPVKVLRMVKPRASASQREIRARDDRWLALVRAGSTHAEACKAVGLSPKTAGQVAAKIRARGLDVPRRPMLQNTAWSQRGFGAGASAVKRRHAWLEIVYTGLAPRAAAVMCGYSGGMSRKLTWQCRAAGFLMPDDRLTPA